MKGFFIYTFCSKLVSFSRVPEFFSILNRALKLPTKPSSAEGNQAMNQIQVKILNPTADSRDLLMIR